MNNAYEVITIPAPILKQIATPIETITGDIKTQVERMIQTLEDANGIGLAANQVAIANRVLLTNVPKGCWSYGAADKSGILSIESAHRDDSAEEDNLIAMINPEIVSKSDEKSVYMEGCLSIPGQYANIIRPAHVVVKYSDVNGDIHEEKFSGLDSHCVQHEIDHLDGKLFIDHLSSLKRNMIVKKFKKQNRAL